MTTVIRPELSTRNKYYLEKHRTYELRHFCLQYPLWKKSYMSLNNLRTVNEIADYFSQYPDPTAQCAIAREYYEKRIHMIDECCMKSDNDLWFYILLGVTKGCTYDNLKLRYNIPCSRDTYYERYRKFFWLLNNARE